MSHEKGLTDPLLDRTGAEYKSVEHVIKDIIRRHEHMLMKNIQMYGIHRTSQKDEELLQIAAELGTRRLEAFLNKQK